ncbi:MAG: D-aminoacyl-tRNA deacylase, partial [Flavobacteriaceae bacterium]
MRVLVQRVSKAQVIIEEGEKREIKEGLLVLLGIEEADDLSDVNWLVKKVINLRVFDDEQGIM